jgi:thioredoxin-dependent peroxiredoxin
MLNRVVPNVTFKTRVRDDAAAGENPFRWHDVSSDAVFADKRIVVFALPGAFTPTCTSEQCPAYEASYDAIRSAGADEVYCLSVNDAFVMFQWGKMLGLEKVKLLPDGAGHFTRRMGMLINKDHLGFGARSWRYSMVVENGKIIALFEESGINDDGSDADPYGESAPEKILAWLEANPHVSTAG